MLIVHMAGAYGRPHKHLGRSESFHVVQGQGDVVIFDDAGVVRRVVSMGDFASGAMFYYRLSVPYYHTLLVHSETLVFLEVTTGPFDRKTTVFAPWSPPESEPAAVRDFLARLAQEVETLKENHP